MVYPRLEHIMLWFCIGSEALLSYSAGDLYELSDTEPL